MLPSHVYLWDEGRDLGDRILVMNPTDRIVSYDELDAEAQKWPTVLVFGRTSNETSRFMHNMSPDADLFTKPEGAFGVEGTVVTTGTGTSKSGLVLLASPPLQHFWDSDGQSRFRDFAELVLRLFQNRVKLTAIVYSHLDAVRKLYKQDLLNCFDLFEKILGPHIYHRLFAVEIRALTAEKWAASDIWSQRVARWQRRGATSHRMDYRDRKSKAILRSFLSETGVCLELQTGLIQQTYTIDSAASHFLQSVETSAQIGRPQTPEERISVATSQRNGESTSTGSTSEIPLPARSHPFRSFVAPLPMSVEEAYRRLGLNQIRLVRLLGGPQTDAISINVFQADLENSPDYEALSYVVGYLPPMAELNLRLGSGEIATLQITHHLEKILKTLRYPNKDRILWVDALSIAQQDAEEKAAQIQNMGRIFETAKNVCVWLGPETPETNAAMEFIPRALDFDDMDAIFANTINVQKQWISLAKLMTAPYFRRRFIVQEVAFAKKATVYCGSKMVDWFDLADAAVLLENHWPALVSQLSHPERGNLGDIHAPGAMSLVQLTSRSLQKDHAGRVQARLVGLESLLSALPMFDTTLPHDTIYSIISLARDTYQGKSLRIDYALDPGDLFAEAVVSIIKATGRLDMICRPWAPFVGSGLPSWICKSQKYPFFKTNNGQYDRRNADSLVGLPERRIYHASGDTSCPSNFQDGSITSRPCLIGRGVEIGVVSTAYEKSQHGSIPDEWLRFRWPAYETIVSAWQVQTRKADLVATANARQTRFREVLWRTLFADRMKDGQVAPRWYVRACHHCLSTSGEHWGEQAVNLDRLIQRSADKLGEVFSRIRDTIWGRKLFQYRHTLPRPELDQEGRLYSLGLGPGELREGDIVAVLFGCSVPLILRELSPQHRSGSDTLRSNGYELIGEAYIHGKMDGEALEKNPDGTHLLTEKTFKIF